MNKEIKITTCIGRCPFYGTSMDGMQCNHPYFDDKGAYENMIICYTVTHATAIPDKCPLREGDLSITYTILN